MKTKSGKTITISRNINKYKTDIVKISYAGYQKEKQLTKSLPEISRETYEEFMLHRLNTMNGLVYLEDEMFTSYMIYDEWEDNTGTHCKIPEWGFGCERQSREKIIGYLFQRLAEEKVSEKTVNFSVDIYAHDIEMQSLFSYMEFGMQAETGVRALDKTENFSCPKVRKIEKDELGHRWTEVWGLVKKLVDHLKQSPVFYLGQEFTEEVYREFFTDNGTQVYIAECGKRIIGVIQTNKEVPVPVFLDREAANTGDIFVLPEYRGMGIAEELLLFAEQELIKKKYQYVWVEHGTANPNARYFWNKYFATYKYEMIRKVSTVK